VGSVRRAARRLIERLAALAGLPLAAAIEPLLRRGGRRAGVVLLYHRIGERAGDPDGELNPALPARLFRAQLRHLARRYRPVPVSRLRAAATDRRPGERFPVAVSFDDDFAEHVGYALPCLRDAGLPGAFFLTGAALDGPAEFWWDTLQRAVDAGMDPAEALGGDPGGPDPRPLHRAAAAIEAMPGEERAAIHERLARRAGPAPPDAGLRAQAVSQLAAAGQEIGFHTLRHDRLPELDDGSLASALRDGRRAVAEAAGAPVAMLAYPHGAADRRVAQAARDAGFAAAFTVRPEAVTPESDALLLGRVEAPFDSVGRLALRLVRTLAGL
jgi:peptidoglycan/xylan/chitin deacetylase (PgdA/CDA1 family)